MRLPDTVVRIVTTCPFDTTREPPACRVESVGRKPAAVNGRRPTLVPIKVDATLSIQDPSETRVCRLTAFLTFRDITHIPPAFVRTRMSDEPAGVSDDVRTTFFGVAFFAATKDRPPRPDLPILWNWSHTKTHAALLGAAVGLLIGFGVLWGEKAAVFGVAAYLTEYIFAERQKRNGKSTCEHGIGAHDVRKKPWYFAAAVVGTAAVIVAVTP